MLTPDLPHYNDPEGDRLPSGISCAIDALCADFGKPLVVHAGREPKSDHYRCDPYAWDRELKWLAGAGLSDTELAQVTWRNAVRFFNLDFDGPLGY